MAKKLVSINLDEELIKELDAVSATLGVSRSALVNIGMRGILLGEISEALNTLIQSAGGTESEARIEDARAVKIGA